MTGALKLRNISGLVGSGTSSSYTSYFNFFEPDGVSRIAYIGKGSTGSDNFYVLNEKGDIRVQVPLGNKVVIPIGDLVIEAGGISATGAASFRLMKNTWYNDADGNPRLYFGDNTADNGTLIRAVRQNQTFGIRNENNLQTVKINMTTGEGIFDGTVKAKDAVADNDLVTKRQLPTYREVTITKKLVSGRWFRVSPEEAGISNPLTDKYIISVKSLSGPGVWEYTYKNLTTTSTTLYQLTLYQNQTINGAQVLVLFNNTTDNYTITLSIIDYN